jgi:tRNA A-37 threonylcarbamoyl transferase component Bud32
MPPTTGEAPAPSIGSIFVPGYEIIEELGRGGMGVVYKARQTQLNRIVAIKMMLSGEHAGKEERARFQAEGIAVARLRHPHIVQIHEVGSIDDRPFFCLEFLSGGSLAGRLQSVAMMAEPAAELVEKLARAVHYAHQQGIIHRDLKPANVLLDEHGQPKITDFGLAKQVGGEGHGPTVTGEILGTPAYMAPEQAAGRTREIGPATDVYSLGAILYELLTGQPPFRSETPLETLSKVLSQPPVSLRRLRASVPYDLETICLKCLHKEPERRYASAAELADDLRRFLEGRPIRARRTGWIERAWRWCRRHPATLFSSLAPLLLLLAMTVLANRQTEVAFEHSSDALVERLQESNLVSARLAASVVQEQLVTRRDLVKQYADRDALREKTKRGRVAKAELRELLRQFHEHQTQLNYFRWSVADRNGVTFATYPEAPKVENVNWSWRDWFNGKGDKPEHRSETFPPLAAAHISQPFLGQWEKPELIIGISAPIHDPSDEKQTIGVLLATVRLDELNKWLTDVQINDGFAVLIDGHNHAVLHRNRERILPGLNQNPPQWRSATYDAARAGPSGSTTYTDPIDSHDYLVSYAPLPEVGWAALVQHDQQAALAPLYQLRGELLRGTWVTIGVVVLMTSGLWGVLTWLRQRRAMAI